MTAPTIGSNLNVEIPPKAKIAVVGSRGYADFEAVQLFIETLPKDVTLISGGAIGVDQTAEKAAFFKLIPVITYLPDYDQFGKSAPIIRNQRIAQECDLLVAFWDGESRGTKNIIEIVKRLGKQVIVVVERGD